MSLPRPCSWLGSHSDAAVPGPALGFSPAFTLLGPQRRSRRPHMRVKWFLVHVCGAFARNPIGLVGNKKLDRYFLASLMNVFNTSVVFMSQNKWKKKARFLQLKEAHKAWQVHSMRFGGHCINDNRLYAYAFPMQSPHQNEHLHSCNCLVLLSPGLSEKYEFGMKFSFLLWKRKLLPPSDVLVLFLIYCISSTCLGSPSPVCCCLKAERSLLQRFPGQGEVFTSLSVVGRKSPQSA